MDKKYLNYDGVLYFWNKIKATFVMKEAGKVLSSNDYTNEEKNKLAALSATGSTYTLPVASDSTLGGIKVGANLTISNGVLSATKSVTKISELTNDTGFITGSAVPTTVSQLTNDAGFITSSSSITGNAATATTATKATQDGAGNIIANTYATKASVAGYQTQDQVNALIASKISNVITYQGSVATAANLPTNASNGHMYNVEEDDMNYVWNGTKWDPQAPKFSIIDVSNADIDAITV